jgi:hypothetical protein
MALADRCARVSTEDMIRTALPATSHTVVMSQLDELNRALMGSPKPAEITATALGLVGAEVLSGRTGDTGGTGGTGDTTGAGGTGVLPDRAILVRMCWDGPSEYPFVHGHFRTFAAPDGALVVDLHTAALQTLSHRLGLRHSWGS